MHAEAVNYISSRSESLAAFWYLCGLLAYLHWRQVEPRESRRAALCYGLSLLAFICGLLSKSIAITFPAVLLWYEMVNGLFESIFNYPWACLSLLQTAVHVRRDRGRSQPAVVRNGERINCF